MDLWIRSQDGTTLLKANKLVIEEDSYACNSYYFIKNYTADIGTKIGKYKKMSRASEVLDEIQRKLGINEKYFTDELPVEEFVYEMPLE